MAWTKHIPPRIKPEACKRRNINPLGGPPSICIVGEETKRSDKNGVETVSIKLISGTKDTGPKFVGGSPKEPF